jgi:hypothetical protein
MSILPIILIGKSRTAPNRKLVMVVALGAVLLETPARVTSAVSTCPGSWEDRGSATAVRYSLGARDRARLKVFNVRGEEVAALVDGIRDAGYGTVEWDAREVPSGVYFFRLEAGEFVKTKRVVLLR